MGRLDGKVALITGAARGQGAAEARLFVAEGAQVMLGDVRDEDGEIVAKDLGDRAAYLRHDVTSERDWDAIVETTKSRFGRVDVLVNNAGVFEIIGMTNTSLDEYMRIVTINQVGTFLGMKAVVKTMIGQRSGSIVNISSVAGLAGQRGNDRVLREQVRGTRDDEGRRARARAVRHTGQFRASRIHRHRDAARRARRESRGDDGRRRTTRSERPARDRRRRREARALPGIRRQRYSTGSEFVVDGGLSAGI